MDATEGHGSHSTMTRGFGLMFGLLLVFGGTSSAVRAQYGKTYQQWTANEAEALIRNSPWAQTRAEPMSVTTLDPQTEPADTVVTVSLRSALPVRQARTRLTQLKNKYDKRNDHEKALIDAKTRLLLECPECAEYYVVAISPGPKSTNPRFKNLPWDISLGGMKKYVELKNEKGETRELVKFVGPDFNDGEAVFYFSRFNSRGEPLISPANRMITISVDSRLLKWAPWKLQKFEFEVSKIIVNGQVIF